MKALNSAAGKFPSAPFLANPRSAASIEPVLRWLFGLDEPTAFDLELRDAAARAAGCAWVEEQYDAAVVLREILNAARSFRNSLAIPQDLGYRREGMLLAGKVFASVAGRTVHGDHPLADRLRAVGAISGSGTRVDILVVGDSSPSPDADVAFLVGTGSYSGARYVFTMEDMDRLTRNEMKRRYPADMAQLLQKESTRLSKSMEAASDADVEASLGRVLAAVEAGLASQYDNADARGAFRQTLSERIQRQIPIADFLTRAVADVTLRRAKK